MAVVLCLVVLAAAVILEIKLVAFLICGGVMAPSIAFSVLIGFNVGCNSSWGWGVLTALAIFALTLFLGRYQKIFFAMTTMTACISSYFIVFFILSFAELLFDLGKFGSWTQAIACVVVTAISISKNMDNPGAGLLEGNEIICRVIASAMYGYAAAFLIVMLLGNCSGIAAYIVWAVGAAAAYFIDWALARRATE